MRGQHTFSKKSLKVVIIRHGEKPSDGENLCPKGFNRALALPAVLDTLIGVPDYTYIPKLKMGASSHNIRMFQTVTPFAVEHNLILNTDYKEEDVTAVAADVLKKTGVVLMVWEHSNIPGLARELGVTGRLSWDKNDFGSVWIIEFSNKSVAPVFSVEQENLNPQGECN